MTTNIHDVYEKQVTETAIAIKAVNKKINRYSLSRLAVIILGSAAIFKAVQYEHVWLVLLLFLGVLLLFMWLVFRHSEFEKEKASLTAFLAVNQNELDIRNGKNNCYPHGAQYQNNRHPYSDDLDVYGDASLFALINRCATVQANDLLAGWLSMPADIPVISGRQEAIQELAADLDWSQQFQAGLYFDLQHKTDVKKLFANLMDEQNLHFGNKLLRIYVKLAPWLVGLAVALSFFEPLFIRLVVVLCAGHLLAALWHAGKVSLVSGKMDKAGSLLHAFSSAFGYIEKRTWESRLNNELSGKLMFEEGRHPASSVFKQLASLINKLDYRLNMLVGAILNMVFLWDFRQVFAILDWRKRYKAEVLQVFDVAAEFEALVSFATLTRNHPGWSFPEILPSQAQALEATALSHPLIPEKLAVANDYQRDYHQIALITGSNMAGKSTFLRTIGANVVLALAGAPVCARTMRVSVFRLATYMRIKDSLNESTSTFKAELNRMQLILETVKRQPDTYFLIDEMLRGTNSVDKYLGSKAIIKQLIADKGVGMVATHDLKLAELEAEYPGVIRNYHFDIQVREGEMLFDYKLKQGECTIFNASLLLKGIGIDVEKA